MTNATNIPPQICENVTPAMIGRMGNAWLIDMDAIGRRLGIESDPRSSVTLPCWIASAAYAHPIWTHYAILSISLRDAPGLPKARIYLEGATHEIMVFALDPATKPAIDDAPRYLHPANFIGQFIEPDDASAEARVRQAVQDVIDGALNPDTDYRSMWVARFSGSNLKPGALNPDFIAASGSSMLVSGTGAANARTLQTLVETAETLRADESKPQ